MQVTKADASRAIRRSPKKLQKKAPKTLKSLGRLRNRAAGPSRRREEPQARSPLGLEDDLDHPFRRDMMGRMANDFERREPRAGNVAR